MKKALILPVFLVSLFFSVSGQSADNLDISVNKQYPDNEYVLGRPVNSTYEYNLDLRSAQVAFAVDETYSMSGPMEGVKDNIQWFFGELGGSAEGTVVGSGAGDASNDRNPYHFTDDAYPGSALPEPRDLGSEEGLMSDKAELEKAAGRLKERTYFEGPDSTVSEALNYGSEASDYAGNIGYYADESYDWNDDSSKAIIWVQSGQAGFGSCSSISDFSSGGLGNYMQDNNFEFYAIVRDLSGCRSNFETTASNTGGKVYDLSNNPSNADWQDILGEISQSLDTSVKLNGIVDQYSYSKDNYDENNLQGDNRNYRFLDAPESSGQQSVKLTWRPVNTGNLHIKSGDSFIEVEQSDGSFKNFYFNDQEISDVKYVDFEVSDFSVVRGGSNVYVEAEISNNGNADSLGESQTSRPRELWLRNSYSHYSVDMPSIPAGGSKNVSFSVSNTRDVVDQNNIEEIRLDVDPSGFWDGLSGETQVSEARGEVLEPDESNNDLQVGYPPRVGAIQFDDIGGEHAFSVEASIDMPTSDPDLGKCRLRFENQDNPDIFPDNGMVEGDLVQDGQNLALCSYSNFNSSVTGFEPTDKVKVNVTVENSNGALGWNTGTHEIINRPPKASFNSPEDGSLVTGLPELEVDVYDPEGDPFNMSFMDRDSQTVLETVENAQQDSPHAIEWDTSLGKHEWRVNFSDPYDKSKTSTWEFERVIGLGYRLEQSLKTDYSSVIISEDGTGSIFIDITNPHPDQKEILTEIKSKNGYFEPTFLQSGTNTTTYSLNEDETKTLQAQIDADSIAESRNDKLVITSTDRNVDSVNTRELDVLVRSSEAEFRDAPGLTSIYLVFIGLASVLLFGLSM